MSIWELTVLALGLAMDAFAVSVCKGLSMEKTDLKKSCTVGIWFGGFQALMPVIGYFLGISFAEYITAVDHWIAFALLFIIGAKMLKEGIFSKEEKADASLSFKTMLVLAVATSIDALAVGITFAFLKVNVWAAVALIGGITFITSAAGLKIGNVFGLKFKSKAEIAGGIVLIAIGLILLIEHLFF